MFEGIGEQVMNDLAKVRLIRRNSARSRSREQELAAVFLGEDPEVLNNIGHYGDQIDEGESHADPALFSSRNEEGLVDQVGKPRQLVL